MICIINLSLLSTGMTYIWTPALWAYLFYILNNKTTDVVLSYSSQNVLTSSLEWLSFTFNGLLISLHHKVIYRQSHQENNILKHLSYKLSSNCKQHTVSDITCISWSDTSHRHFAQNERCKQVSVIQFSQYSESWGRIYLVTVAQTIVFGVDGFGIQIYLGWDIFWKRKIFNCYIYDKSYPGQPSQSMTTATASQTNQVPICHWQ